MTWANEALLGFDLEATGVDPLVARPVSFALAYFDSRQLAKGRYALINPGVPIPPETTAIHHITDEMVAERGGDLARSVDGIVGELMSASIAGTPVVGMNLRYDLTMIDRLFREFNGEGLIDVGWTGPVVDILVLDRALDKFRKGSRKLGALASTYGVGLANAHDAAADTSAAVLVAIAIADKYPQVGELDLTQLHRTQRHWHRLWATEYSSYRVEKGDTPLDPAEMFWPLAYETHEGEEVDAPAVPLAEAQVQSLNIRLTGEFGLTNRQDRIAAVTQLVGSSIKSTKEITTDEYESLAAILDAPDAAGRISLAVANDLAAHGGGNRPPDGLAAHTGHPRGLSGGPSYEPFGPIDIGDASQAIIMSTMRLAMKLSSEKVSEYLREFGLPRSGDLTEKRLRFYEFACRERAVRNEKVEAIFAD
jgi:DNA polymerase-3 subunit epsilon